MSEPGNCPQCGMKLIPAQLVSEAGAGHEHHDHGEGHEHSDAQRVMTTRPLAESSGKTTWSRSTE